MEHRETLEEFFSQLNTSLEILPDADSKPVSEAPEKGKRILAGEEHLTSLEKDWIESLTYNAIKYLPRPDDLVAFVVLVDQLAKLGLPIKPTLFRAISIGMAYQAEQDKHIK